MKFYSLNKTSPTVDFKTATIHGQAPDKGLYFPEYIPQLPAEFWQNISQYDDLEIAYRIMKPYVGDTLNEKTLKNILAKTLSFPFPLVRITDTISILELFHGPTLAFKDVGATFMSLCFSEFVKDIPRKVVVLVATSGDTGGAVAQSFHGVENLDVVILFPSGKVSPVQEKQLTTQGGNIHTLEVMGDFDDCQALVKQAFADESLTEKVFLTSANSINVARWLPQQIYYALAWKQLSSGSSRGKTTVLSVPSGNFGNLSAGMLLQRSGLPIKKFIAACNANEVIPEYLMTGIMKEQKAKATLSNAMDVANPSNFIRVMELTGNNISNLKNILEAFSITDEETMFTIREVYHEYNYILDPHAAVGYRALEKYQEVHQGPGIILGTAHPVKFPGVVEKQTGLPVEIPSSLKSMMDSPSNKAIVPPQYEIVKNVILKLQSD
jgi:threonine synthase